MQPLDYTCAAEIDAYVQIALLAYTPRLLPHRPPPFRFDGESRHEPKRQLLKQECPRLITSIARPQARRRSRAYRGAVEAAAASMVSPVLNGDGPSRTTAEASLACIPSAVDTSDS